MRASLIVKVVNHLPTVQETWVRFTGWEDSLEKERATQSSTLAWRVPWTEEPRRHSPGMARVRHDLMTKPLPQKNTMGITTGRFSIGKIHKFII